MTIASEITRIQTNIANAYDAAEAKGATMPVTENSDNLAITIESITVGGDVITATNNTGANISKGDKVWINKSGNNYNLINFLSSNYDNFTSLGSVNINNSTGVVSNFSSNNYLVLPKTFPSSITSMDLVIGFNTQTLLSADSPFLATINPVKTFFVSWEKKLGYWDNSNYVTGTTILTNNTDYLLRVIYDGNNFKYYLIQDAGYTIDTLPDISQWSLEITSNSNYFSSSSFFIGCCPENDQYFPGTIKLAKTYIKLNDEFWWVGKSIQITENTLTGIAAENIVAGSTGLVNVASGALED